MDIVTTALDLFDVELRRPSEIRCPVAIPWQDLLRTLHRHQAFLLPSRHSALAVRTCHLPLGRSRCSMSDCSDDPSQLPAKVGARGSLPRHA